jgi:hypothetical protein
MDYFIDESGNTGDLARSDSLFSFGEQPFFSLAAVGLDAAHSLEPAIEQLKASHRIKLPELKASALYDRPQFIYELVENLCAQRSPYFVEVVEKKYFLATHITSRQLLPPVAGVAENAMFHWVKNVVADYLYERAPDDVYIKFIAACECPSDETLRAQLDSLIQFADPSINTEEPAVAVYEGANAVLAEYCEAVAGGNKEAYRDFLPIPDDSLRGKPIWVLPNLSAFTNVYARINLYEEGSLSTARLIHDEHAHFEHIFRISKRTVEALQERAKECFTPYSNFVFRETAELSFARSQDTIGLQLADVLAGFCMRFVKDFFFSPKQLSCDAREVYRLLLRFSDPARGVGLNYVMSSGRAAALNLLGLG